MTQFQDERDEQVDTENDGLVRQQFVARIHRMLHPTVSSTQVIVPLVDQSSGHEHSASPVQVLTAPESSWTNLDEPLEVFEERWRAVRSEPYVPIVGGGIKSPEVKGYRVGLVSSFQDMPGR